MEITSLLPWSQALLTPVVLLLGVFISWRQMKTNNHKLRFDLFEKRYAIYQEAGSFITSMMDEGKPSLEAQQAFLKGTQGSKLLFGDEVAQHLHELWVDAVKMETHQFISKDLPSGEKRTEHVQAVGAIKMKLPAHFEKLDKVMLPYMRMDSIR